MSASLRTATAVIAIVMVGGCSHSGAHPVSASRRSAAVTPTTPIARSKFCALPISRAAAIARATSSPDEADRARAKLFGTDYWQVMVAGPITPALARGGPYGWAVFDVDAHTGDIRGVRAGPPGSTASDWNALPDPAAGCGA